MTQLYGEYSTVYDVRTKYRGATTTETGQDSLFLALIRSTSRDMDAACGRRFYPRIETRYFDMPRNRILTLDDDLLAVNTLTNGDGNELTSSQYDLIPYNQTPYYQLRLKASSQDYWQTDSNGNSERAISLAGVWGFHRDYSGALLDTGATLAAAITDTTGTSFTCTTGKLYAGYLIKIDSEYLYVSAVTTGASDTVTVVRGVNGSTAATHLVNTPIYRWYNPEIESICTMAVAAYERLKTNPVGESITLDGQTFQTPKDIHAWVRMQCKARGLARVN